MSISMYVVAVVVALFATAWQCAAAETHIDVADSTRKYRFLAKTARDQQRYADAARYYAAYLRYRPRDVRAHYYLGKMLLETGNAEGATRALTHALALDSLHVNSNLLLYGIYTAADTPDSAARCLERVLRVRPQDVRKRRVLADLYRRQGRSEEAARQYEILATKVQDPTEIAQLLTVLYEDLGRPEKALEWRTRLRGRARSSTEEAEALEDLYRLQIETGKAGAACRTLEELARVDTSNRYSYYSRMVQLAEDRNEDSLRVRGWEGMVRANPRDLDTVSRLVEYFLNADSTRAAAEWLERGLAVDGTDAHLQLLRGDLLSRKGDEKGALAAFETARADPRWEAVAQQRIWQIRPPETREEKLRKAFFGDSTGERN